jgi:hypothetical protein
LIDYGEIGLVELRLGFLGLCFKIQNLVEELIRMSIYVIADETANSGGKDE